MSSNRRLRCAVLPQASRNHVGETVESATEKGLSFVIGKANYRDNARGQIIGDQEGFLKLLVATSDRRVLGVHAIGEHATELVHLGQLAMMLKADVEIFIDACFNYPTLADMYKMAAYDAMARLGLL